MTERQIKLAIGALLHDIGKVIYRGGDAKNHSESGYLYLKETAGIKDSEILNCVRYHHSAYLKNAPIPKNSLAYLVYCADNIAAAADRREKDAPEYGFDQKMPLSSIFNILNGNRENKHYALQKLDPSLGINFPGEAAVKSTEVFYQEIVRELTTQLKGISFEESYLNSLLTILEADLTYIPSSTAKKELADISLYDHVKLTAAIALCMECYLEAAKTDDYQAFLYVHAEKAYAENMFLLYSMDISGIQSFIYTISSEGALRGLRARSFYLELLMEHMIDELLLRLSLPRTNLIYAGGGHCYLLLPNTEEAKKQLDAFERDLNQWFLNKFGIDLYVAGGKAVCCANELHNEPEGSYTELFRSVSAQISKKKSHRYSSAEIRMLNRKKRMGERECKVCRRLEQIDANGRCPFCSALDKLSGNVLNGTFFAVKLQEEGETENLLPLPFGKCLCVYDTQEEAKLRSLMQTSDYVRCYTKNKSYSGKLLSTHLWVGSYAAKEKTFEELAESAKGIERLGVLRADVDNLGKTFAEGFSKNGNARYVSLSRTAALSRQLSLFFKASINYLLGHCTEGFLGGEAKKKLAIVYSGGDDVFLVGAWNDVIEAFAELHKQFTRYTQNTLHISGGIGIYHAGYPVNVMAKEVEELESSAKSMDGKNAICLFDESNTYPWDEFLNNVIAEKLQVIQTFFDQTEDHGNAFLYRLVDFMRNADEKINIARFVYLLSRMEPDKHADEAVRKAYQTFAKQMFTWIHEEKERHACITAMYLYVYLNREKEEAQDVSE